MICNLIDYKWIIKNVLPKVISSFHYYYKNPTGNINTNQIHNLLSSFNSSFDWIWRGLSWFQQHDQVQPPVEIRTLSPFKGLVTRCFENYLSIFVDGQGWQTWESVGDHPQYVSLNGWRRRSLNKPSLSSVNVWLHRKNISHSFAYDLSGKDIWSFHR